MRCWEIDAARGIAVLWMIAYHFVFDITYFSSRNTPFWLALIGASIFIFTSGISLSISYSRNSNFLKFAKRGIKLLLLGLLITFVSYLLLRDGFVVFGILHFFGVSSFLLYPFLKYLKNKLYFLALGLLIIFSGIYLLQFRFGFSYLFWLGVAPVNFYSLDFFPLLPWFGVYLIGVFLGKFIYPKGKRKFKFPESDGVFSRIFIFLGKNSLAIYFLHQPIIIFILFLLGRSEILSILNI